MELTELVSPQIAMPVIGVVVCAIMVFAFGFRSPVQPPSFNFEEEKRTRRKTKQTKLKGPINGLVVTNEPASEVLIKPTPKAAKEVKAASSPKAKLNESKNVARKEVKQEAKGEKKGKVKKEASFEETKPESGKKNKAASAKKETEDDGEWTTIQVSKKGKKQKPDKKKDSGQPESPFKPDTETEPPSSSSVTPDLVTATPAADVSKAEEPSSPQTSKSKKKKEKLTEKNQAEAKEDSPVIAATEEPLSASPSPVQGQGESKKKRSRKEKKPSPSSDEVVDFIQETASEKDVKPASTPAAAPVDAEQADTEQTKPSPKKKKTKGKKSGQEDKAEKALEIEPKQVEKSPERVKKSTGSSQKQEKSPETVKKSTDAQQKQEKSAEPSKKSADSKQDKSAEPARTDADIQLKQPDKPAEPSRKETDKKKIKNLNKAAKTEPEAPPSPASHTDSQTAAPASSPSISFDEMGDSWQEATPKSKKKKPRRDN